MSSKEPTEIQPVDTVRTDNLHPLENNWTLWHFKPVPGSKNWMENQHKLLEFETVEGFWSVYNNIILVSELGMGQQYSLFKTGIEPMWEDPGNKDGGRWLINIPGNVSDKDLDRYWLETLLCLIGEAFEEAAKDVCGAVINIGPKISKLGVWTANVHDGKSILKIGRVLKQRLGIKEIIYFEAHTDKINKYRYDRYDVPPRFEI